jgi:hypothetical protein
VQPVGEETLVARRASAYIPGTSTFGRTIGPYRSGIAKRTF